MHGPPLGERMVSKGKHDSCEHCDKPTLDGELLSAVECWAIYSFDGRRHPHYGLHAVNAMKTDMNGVSESSQITVKIVAQRSSIVSTTLKNNSIKEETLFRLMAYPLMRPAV